MLSLRMRRSETRARLRTPTTVDQGHAAAFRVTRAVVSRLAHGAPVEAGWRRSSIPPISSMLRQLLERSRRSDHRKRRPRV